MFQEYRRRRDYLAGTLPEIPGMKPWYPPGGLYFFADISETGLRSEEVFYKLLEEAKVFGFPGESYGPEGYRFVRLSFVKELARRTAERDSTAAMYVQAYAAGRRGGRGTYSIGRTARLTSGRRGRARRRCRRRRGPQRTRRRSGR